MEQPMSEDDKNRILLYEYVLLLFVEWYCNKEKITTPEQFNDRAKYDFNFSKLIIWPYFFCTANGSTKQLSDFFGPFHARLNGPVSKPIYDFLLDKNSTLSYLTLNNDDHFAKIQIDSDLLVQVFLKDSIEKLRKQVQGLSFQDNEETKYYYQSLEKSVGALVFRTQHEFITYSSSSLSIISKDSRTYMKARLLYRINGKKNIEDTLMNAEAMGKDLKAYPPERERSYLSADVA